MVIFNAINFMHPVLMFNSANVLNVIDAGERRLYLAKVAFNLFITLKAASNFYKIFCYQGGISGFLHLAVGEDTIIYEIIPDGYHREPFYENKVSLLPNYKWEIEMDTAMLFDPKSMQIYFIDKIMEIYWALGISNVQTKIIEKFLEDYGWYIK